VDVQGQSPQREAQEEQVVRVRSVYCIRRVMVDSGWDRTAMNDTVEIFTAGTGSSPEYPMNWNNDGVPSVPPFYMRQHVLPNGKVFYSGQDTDTKLFDPTIVSTTNSGWPHVASAWPTRGNQ
jgi:hypothetical protein